VLQDFQVILELLEHLVLKVPKVLLVLKDLQDQLVIQVKQDHQDRQVQ
jgi:hypothetical protein